jgi:hypothetical protein
MYRRLWSWDVKVSTPVKDWMLSTDDRTYAQIMERIRVLRQVGPGLGRPLADDLLDRYLGGEEI